MGKEEKYRKIIQKHRQNDNTIRTGIKLIEFAIEINMVIVTTHF